jgi:sporulation protein YlmC with PRC-barrel domain
MLFFGSKIENLGLFSVRSAGRIGTATKPIINPHNLHIDGFYAHAMNGQNEGVIVDIDIRDFSIKGLIINDHEDISDPDDLVRLKPIMDINFSLVGKQVYENKRKIGKVADYAVDTESLFVQKLYVQPTLLKSMGTSQLIFDRQSIIEITDTKIVVSGPEVKASNSVSQKLSPPVFRSASTSTMSE